MRAFVARDGAELSNQAFDLLLEPGKSLRTGVEDFEKAFGVSTTLEQDLLTLASAIFAVDVAVKRGFREQIVRDIHLTIPVINLAQLNQCRSALEDALYVLSHDNWTLEFVGIAGTPEHSLSWVSGPGYTLLFSGGLDSFAAAVDLLDEVGPDNMVLASHVTGNPTTKSSQKKLHAYLETVSKKSIQRVVLRTGGMAVDDAPPVTTNPEVTQRTRSFMFLTIAALVARRTGHSNIIMIAENGQMAIHLPLSSARIGAFSTHTAHPNFVARMTTFFTTVLQVPLHVDNPYLYKTKAEVVANLCANHATAIADSVSCWKSSRVATGHCGECVPCYIRRIALEANGFMSGGWARDIFSENVAMLAATDEGKRNLIELASFAEDFRSLSDAELDIRYCELYHPSFDRESAAEMYRKFGLEAQRVFANYPDLTFLG